jgi:hypothetical protein
LKLGRTPRELLEATDSASLGELFAYHALLNDERQAEKDSEALASWG